MGRCRFVAGLLAGLSLGDDASGQRLYATRGLEKVRAAGGTSPKPEELFLQQKLDHFNGSDSRTFSHRYLLNKDYWGVQKIEVAEGCQGPILLYTGHESDIRTFWEKNGFMIEVLAPKLGGMLLFPEERYYGKSYPFGRQDSLKPDNARYLTTAQILEDIVSVVNHVKDTVPGAKTCPVVAFGGAYGGTLTALLRASHPEVVIGGLAASSELGYYDKAGWSTHGVDEFTFEEVVMNTWKNARPGCLAAVEEAIAAIDARPRKEMVETLNACDSKALGPGPASTLFAYVLEGMPQGDHPFVAFPVTQCCDDLLRAQKSGSSDHLIKAAAGTIEAFYPGRQPCVPYDAGGPGNTPGDGPGRSSWGYQSCTETLHTFSARVLRNYTFDYDKSAAVCEDLFQVRPNVTALSAQFGGAYAMAEGRAGVTNLIWSQGTLDPWHGWFKNIKAPPADMGIYHFLMEGSAQYTDLLAPHEHDPPSVTNARKMEEEIIRGWIKTHAAEQKTTRETLDIVV